LDGVAELVAPVPEVTEKGALPAGRAKWSGVSPMRLPLVRRADLVLKCLGKAAGSGVAREKGVSCPPPEKSFRLSTGNVTDRWLASVIAPQQNQAWLSLGDDGPSNHLMRFNSTSLPANVGL